jgi:hypothetical protein
MATRRTPTTITSTHPFHAFETFGLVAMIDGSGTFNNLGTIGDGELHFDRSPSEPGALVESRFEATDYQTACLGTITPGEAPPLE